jgi:hypothetical protein
MFLHLCLCTDILCRLKVNLTLILLMCRIWWAPNNASKWQMGFNLAFKGLNIISHTSNLMFLWPTNYRFKFHGMGWTSIHLFVTVNYSLHLNELKFAFKLCLPAEEIVTLPVLFLQSELAVGILICGFES